MRTVLKYWYQHFIYLILRHHVLFLRIKSLISGITLFLLQKEAQLNLRLANNNDPDLYYNINNNVNHKIHDSTCTFNFCNCTRYCISNFAFCIHVASRIRMSWFHWNLNQLQKYPESYRKYLTTRLKYILRITSNDFASIVHP